MRNYNQIYVQIRKWPEANFSSGEKSADGEKSEVFSGSGREGFLRKTLCSLCADSYVNLRVVSCNEENVTFSHFTGGS